MAQDQKPKNSPISFTLPSFQQKEIPYVYVQNFQYKLNNTDLSIIFLKDNLQLDGSISLSQELSVTLTHMTLKVLTEQLSSIVRAIEQERGPIKIPENARNMREVLDQLMVGIRATKLVE